MLNLYKLQIFAVVAQAGSFSAAAERLYITQPAVSQHMKDLETHLGRQLFVRGRRGLQLTPEGDVLLGYTRRILALVAEAENALVDVAGVAGGKVSLSATPGIAVYLAPDWVQRFRDQYPHLSVTLQTGITSQVVEEVLAGQVDMGFIEGELERFHEPRLAWQALAEIEQMVVVGFRHPWWDAPLVRLEDLRAQTFLMRPPNSQSRKWLESVLLAHGIEPQVGAEFDNLESTKRAIASGTCIAILPRYVVAGDAQLHAIPLDGAPLCRTLKLVWDKEGFFSPVARAFLASLRGDFPTLDA